MTKLLDAWEATASGLSGQQMDESEAYHLSDMLSRIAEERAELADLDQSRALARRGLVAIGRQKGTTKVFNLGYVAGRLFKARRCRGRTANDRAGSSSCAELPDSKDKVRAMIYLAESIREISGVDKAIAMAGSFDKSWLEEQVRLPSPCPVRMKMNRAGRDPVAIKVTVGAEQFTITDQAATRRDLPKLAQAVRKRPATRSSRLERLH